MNENNYIKVSDEVLNLINYENAYEILLVLNILKLAKPHKMIWGETSFLTTPLHLYQFISNLKGCNPAATAAFYTAIKFLYPSGALQ